MSKAITAQDIFNKVWDWFIVQKKPQSMGQFKSNDKSCLYRGDDGAKCAVGVLIPDYAYRAWMEGNDITSLYRKTDFFERPGLKSLRPHYDLLNRIQDVHDAFDMTGRHDEFTRYMKRSLTELAIKVGLTVPDYEETSCTQS